MNKLYVFLVLFFNLNFAVQNLVNFSNEESTDFVFKVLDSNQIKNGELKEF